MIPGSAEIFWHILSIEKIFLTDETKNTTSAIKNKTLTG